MDDENLELRTTILILNSNLSQLDKYVLSTYISCTQGA